MPSQNYDWKRFWCPATGNLKLDDWGFLYDPESEYGHVINPDVLGFEAISHIPCLILLGEAGIGKTTAIKQIYEQVKQDIERAQSVSTGGSSTPAQMPDDCLLFSLGDYNSEEILCKKIFGARKFEDWLTGTHQLHLFLDSLDEGLLSMAILTRILKREINELPCDRLYLRITCRTADWANSLEEKFQEKWGKDYVGKYELCPLRDVDVIKAIERKGINREPFFAEISDKEAVSLSIRPNTLKFLLDIYLKNGKLPLSQHKLYEQGCLELCKEINTNRVECGFTGKLSEKQRLIVAGRIAAISIFTNRAAIWTSSEQEEMPDSDIAIKDLCVGKECIDGQEFVVDKDSIEEVLSGTGLFSSRGTNRMGFAHKTYSEFLAAWYLVHHEMPLTQIMSLIISPEDRERKLVPQLHETAAWLASLRIDVLQEIIKTDPEVLLRSDISTDAVIREAIVGNLLKLYDEGKQCEREWGSYPRYKKLKHPRLAEQLRPYIQNDSKKFEARYEAINISHASELEELQTDLVNLAIDPSQPIHLRVNATSVICSVGNPETKLKLKPLIVGETVEDETEGLKGYALKALWSDYLTAEELFNAITRNSYRSCKYFLDNELIPKLQPTDLAIALNWVERQGVRCDGHPFEKFGDDILIKALDYLNLPEVRENFARAALVQWRESQDLISNSRSDKEQFKTFFDSNDEQRRKLLEQIVLILPAEELPVIFVDSVTEHFNLKKDLLWMVEKIQATESQHEQEFWAELIKYNFDRQDSEQINALLIGIQNHQVLRQYLAEYFEPIELTSVHAEYLKSNYLKMLNYKDEPLDNWTLDPPPKERVLICLNELELGNLDAWWRLNLEMTLKPYSGVYDDEDELDLTKLPGWREANAATQTRIINGAKKYITEQEQITYDWIGTNQFDRPAVAGCRALLLVLKESSEFLDTIPSQVWRRWASIIVACPLINRIEDCYLDLVKLAYLNAPDETIDTLMQLIDRENEERGSIRATNKFEKCWSDRLKSALLEKAQDKALKPECMGDLLEELLKHDSTEAREFAESLITYPLPYTEEDKQRTFIASKILIRNSDSNSWLKLWDVIRQDTEFGRQILESAVYYWNNIDLKLTEKQLADLYIWVVQQYPYDEDPVHEGVHSPTSRDNIVSFRNKILDLLKDAGTHQACCELQHIVELFPQITWLTRILLEAQNNRRRKTWKPPTPNEIFQLVSDSNKRLIQDGNELLDILIEALEQLQIKLQGQIPAVIDLWNEIKWTQVRKLADSLVKQAKTWFSLQKNLKIEVWKEINWRKINGNTYIPKDEERLSDYLARYLKDYLGQKGIVINREVEIRRGEITDIQIDAIAKKPSGEIYDYISVIIEVKGCWNPELNDAMEKQLVERYLKDNTCQHGLYLIGWFNCSQWDTSDSRKSKAPKISIEKARQQFERQAETLSQSNVAVRAFVLNTALR